MRVRKTLEGIQTAFRKLVLENGYFGLTVSALYAEAKIGRKTFYVYYDSLEALLEATLEQLTKAYAGRIRGLRVPDDIQEITRQFYLFSLEQGAFYDRLVCSESCQAVGARLLMRFVRETWQDSPWFRALRKEAQDILLCFIYNTGASLYRQWVVSGKTIPLETMIGFADTLLARGIQGLRESQGRGCA